MYCICFSAALQKPALGAVPSQMAPPSSRTQSLLSAGKLLNWNPEMPDTNVGFESGVRLGSNPEEAIDQTWKNVGFKTMHFTLHSSSMTRDSNRGNDGFNDSLDSALQTSSL